MIDPTMLAALTGIVGAILAACWSWLMASKVAAPKAAQRSKLLLVNILTGATAEDREILEHIKGSLVRPEVERLLESMPEMPESITIPETAFDTDAIATKIFGMMQGEKGNMMKDMQRQLQGFEGPINELAEGLMNEARQAQGPTDIALMKLLNVELNPAFKKKNPQLAFLIESGKVTIAQLAEIARATGYGQKQGGNVVQESTQGWNPGLR